MAAGKQPHILNASSNLVGICFVLITGLKLTRASADTLADEISVMAAFCLLGSCLLSYLSIRTEKSPGRCERVADYLFLAGLGLLFVAVMAFSTGIL